MNPSSSKNQFWVSDPPPSSLYKQTGSGLDKISSRFLAAAKCRDLEELEKCIRDGVNVNVLEDNCGGAGKGSKNSALHLILSHGCYNGNCVQGTERCLQLLLENNVDTNLVNGDGKSALHLVVEYMLPLSFAKLLINYGATVTTKNGLSDSSLIKIAKRMPEVATAILDSAVSFSPVSLPYQLDTEHRKEDKVRLDWSVLVYNPEVNLKGMETKFLNKLLKYKNSEAAQVILMHPLVQAFLSLKKPLYWKKFGYAYFLWILLTLSLYLAFLWTLYNVECRYQPATSENSNDTTEINQPAIQLTTLLNDDSASLRHKIAVDGQCSEVGSFLTAMAYTIMVFFTVGPLVMEVRKLKVIGIMAYLQMWQNYILVAAAASVTVTLYPALSMKSSYHLTWQYPCAALGMLLTSVAILIQLTPIPFVAIYVEMMFLIFKRILLACLAFSPIIVGFYWAFLILLTHSRVSIFQFLTMVVSDTDYEALMDDDRGGFYNFVTYLFFSLFAIIIIIVLLNFLIGLAVNDIGELKKTAKFISLKKQVRSYYLMDAMYGVYNSKFQTSITKNGTTVFSEFCPFLVQKLERRQERHHHREMFRPTTVENQLDNKLQVELLQLARMRVCQTH